MLVEQAGRQFDPVMIDAFVALDAEFRLVATQLADDTQDTPALNQESP